MKILFISGGDYKYGAPKSMMTMAESLRDIYHIDIVLLTKRKNLLNEYCDQHGIENYSFWYRDIMAGSPYTSKILTIAKHLVKYLAYLWGGVTLNMINRLPFEFTTIDIIHSNTNRQDIGGYLASKYKIKHIWHIREMGKEDYNVIFYKSHCISYMNEHADAFIMISDAVRDKWQQIGIDANKVYTLYDGMECKEITKHLTKGKKSKNKVRIVITGHVQPNKGQLHLVQAIARLPVAIKNTVELDIIGEAYPDYKKEIEKQIIRTGIQEQVHLLDYMNNLNELLPEYDIGVTCSKAEGLGRCTAEYMLSGLLTIASNTGANPEIIQDKVTGILYKYGDIDELMQAILWGIEHTKESRQIAHAGSTAAQMMFSKEQYAENLYQIYNKYLDYDAGELNQS